MHIVVVEDEATQRDLLVDYLARQGYRVSGAEGGVALRRLVERELPALVMLDVGLPGEDGFTLARWLRERSSRVGIIMVTAATDTVDRIVGLETGADDYIAKPFEPRELLARVKSVLRRVAAVFPWAVAAAVLIAIPGTVVPVLGIFKTAEHANREAASAKLTVADTTTNLEVAKNEVTRSLNNAEFQYTAALQAQTTLLDRWTEEQKSLDQKAMVRKFSVDVLKPATVVPGAPNDFIVVVNDKRDWETVGKNTVAEIHAVDASDAVIFTQPLNNEARRPEARNSVARRAGRNPMPNCSSSSRKWTEDARTELQERIRPPGQSSPRCSSPIRPRTAPATGCSPLAHARPHYLQTAHPRADSRTNCSNRTDARPSPGSPHRHDGRRSRQCGREVTWFATLRVSPSAGLAVASSCCRLTCPTVTTSFASPKVSTPADSRQPFQCQSRGS